MVNDYIIANDMLRIRTNTWTVHWYIQSAANRIFFSTQKICILPFVVCCPLTYYILGKVNFTRLDFAFFCMAPLKYTCVESYMGDYYLSWNFPYCFSNISLIKFAAGIFYSISIYKLYWIDVLFIWKITLCKIPFVNGSENCHSLDAFIQNILSTPVHVLHTFGRLTCAHTKIKWLHCPR